MSDSTSASGWSLWSFGFPKSWFQLCQFWVSEMLSGALSSSLSTGWLSIVWIRRTFYTWVCPPRRSFAHKDGGKRDLSDNLNAATPSGWMSAQDTLMISSVSEIYPTTVIWLVWEADSFCAARRIWLLCQISKTSWTLASLCNVLSSDSHFIAESFSVFVGSNDGSSPNQYPLIGSSQLPYNYFLAKGHACGFRLPPADSISPGGISSLHSDTVWDDRQYVVCQIRHISALSVRIILLVPPVGDIGYRKCTVNLDQVEVVIIEIWINLPPDLWWFRQSIHIEPDGDRWAFCAIALSRCCFGHIIRG